MLLLSTWFSPKGRNSLSYYMQCRSKEYGGSWLVLLRLQQSLAYRAELTFIVQHFPECLIHGYILKQS